VQATGDPAGAVCDLQVVVRRHVPQAVALAGSGQMTGGQGFDGVWPRTPSESCCGDFAFGQDV